MAAAASPSVTITTQHFTLAYLIHSFSWQKTHQLLLFGHLRHFTLSLRNAHIRLRQNQYQHTHHGATNLSFCVHLLLLHKHVHTMSWRHLPSVAPAVPFDVRVTPRTTAMVAGWAANFTAS
jgi:hypothetical protein